MIDGCSAMLLEEYSGKLDAQGQSYVEAVRSGIMKMSRLIRDLLDLSRVGRAPLRRQPVSLTQIAHEVIADLRKREPARNIAIEVADGLTALGDARLMNIVLVNLMGNAWKYTAKRPEAHVVFSQQSKGDEMVFCLEDNGAGFNMADSAKLFAPFQRLHEESEFEGTGVGLATVQRVISRHGGRIWAEGTVGVGATFYFTLGEPGQ